MNEAIFQDMVRTIYATFGRTPPCPEILGVLFGQVRQIPDEVCAYVTGRICDLDRLPQNLGRELRNAWADWRAANPALVVRHACRACRDAGVRDVWSAGDGGWRHFAVPCPACSAGGAEARNGGAGRGGESGAGGRIGDSPAPLRALERLGCRIMPVDYPGGPVAYDRDNGFGCFWPRGLDVAAPRRTLKVGVDPRRDPRRADPREEERYAR